MRVKYRYRHVHVSTSQPISQCSAIIIVTPLLLIIIPPLLTRYHEHLSALTFPAAHLAVEGEQRFLHVEVMASEVLDGLRV